jgi:hypothetical protein
MGSVAKVLVVIAAIGVAGVFVFAVQGYLTQDLPTPVRNQAQPDLTAVESPTDGCCSSSGGCGCSSKARKDKTCCCSGGKSSANPATPSPAVRASGLIGSFLANPLTGSALLSSESQSSEPNRQPSLARVSALIGSSLVNDPLTASALLSAEAGNTKQTP